MCLREWLSGGAPPCQGGGRGFDPRLALFYFYFKEEASMYRPPKVRPKNLTIGGRYFYG